MRALEERALFAGVSAALSGSADLRSALHRCLALVAEWAAAPQVTLWLLEGGLLRPVLSSTGDPGGQAPCPVDRHPGAPDALRTKRPVRAVRPDGTAVVVVPLIVDTGAAGVLTLEQRAEPLDDEPLATLGRITGAFAMGVHQLQALDEARRSAAQLDALHAIHHRITAATALEDTLRLVVEQAAVVLGAASARLWLVDHEDPTTLVVAAVAGPSGGEPGSRQPANVGLSGWLVEHGTRLLVHERSAGVTEPPDAVAAASLDAQAESAAGVCLRGNDGTPLGALAILDPAPYRFTRTDLATLERLGEHAALALEMQALREREHQEADRLRLLQRAVEQVGDGIALITPDGRVAWANAAYAHLHGYSPEELIGQSVRTLQADDTVGVFTALATRLGVGEVVRTEGIRVRRDGSTWPAAITLTGYSDPEGKFVGVVSTMQDITDRRELEDQLRAAAFTDPLTGLPNRAGLTRHLKEAASPPAAVLFIDLDDFKIVNDTHGHSIGDALLVAAAHRILGCLRPADLLARLGGDEFVVVLYDYTSGGGAEQVASRVRAALRRPARLGTVTVAITGTVGIAVPQPGESPQRLIERADQAMYAGKRRGA